MSLSREDAERALAEIGAARDRVDRTHAYADAAPFLVLWGAIWLVANVVTDIRPRLSDAVWLGGMAVGVPATIALCVSQARRWGARLRQAGVDARRRGLRQGLTQAVVIGFFAATAVVTWPLDARQINAFISLFWAFAYMGAGVWIGWRLVLIGGLTAAAILFGYLALDRHYYLWMGLVAGGGLIAGGLWLRKI